MAIAHVAGGQVGADTTGNFSSSFVAGTCNAAVVFIVSNATNAAPVSGNVTYGGVTMKYLGSSVDTATELGRVDAYFLGDGDCPSGTQTIAFTQSGGATKRVYAASMSCAAGKEISNYRNALQPLVDAIPTAPALGSSSDDANIKYNGFAFYSLQTTTAAVSVTVAVPSTRTLFGYGAAFSGTTAGSISVANGTEIAEANFSGNAQAASFLRASATVNNGNLTMGWSQANDDGCASWILVEECDAISGNYTHSGSAVTDGHVTVLQMPSVGDTVTVRETVATDGSGNWNSNVPVGMKWLAVPYRTNGGSMYVDAPHASLL